MILTIDGGTTNTRLYLIDAGEILVSEKLSIGIRDALFPEGKKKFFHDVSNEITKMTAEASAGLVEAVVCSGMIGSENGLYACPHITAPVSFYDLAEAMIPVSLPRIAPYPFLFVPGVKTYSDMPGSAAEVTPERLAEMDVMRGEETELAGICAKLGIRGDHTFLLPGSHMKTVRLDRDGRIATFHTSLTGELLNAVAEYTILKASVGWAYPETADLEQLRRGYAFAQEYGISRALFKVRILDIAAGGMTENELFAFLLGILLFDDVSRLIRENCPITVGGSDPFRGAFRLLLMDGGVMADEVPKEISDCASAYGAWEMWTHRVERKPPMTKYT